MAKYKILKTFPGAPDGRHVQTFEAGTECELTPYLVSCVDPKWIEEIKEKPGKQEDKAAGKAGAKDK